MSVVRCACCHTVITAGKTRATIEAPSGESVLVCDSAECFADALLGTIASSSIYVSSKTHDVENARVTIH